jgi:3-oxoadipate enol-lactonase
MSESRFLERGSLRLHYRIDGKTDAPWLMLCNSLGTNLHMWEPQMAALMQHFCVLRYDARGHGDSSVPESAFTMADLAGDAIALLDHLDIAKTHFCGLSLGGMTGMWLGTHHGARIARLVLSNTSPYMGPPSNWDMRIKLVTEGSMTTVTDSVIARWFTPRFRETSADKVAIVQQMLLDTSVSGYTGCCAAIRDMDQRTSIAAITNRTLVIAGSRDPSTPPTDGKAIAAAIAGSRYLEFDAAHLSNWEQTEQYNKNLCEFLMETV